MRYFHSVRIRVFSSQDNAKEALAWLTGLDFEKEKIVVEEKVATGLNEQPIHILSLHLEKQRRVRTCTELLHKRIKEKATLLQQLSSRLDDNLDFFLRFEKTDVFAKKLKLTDTGDCFHLKLSVAAFPKSKKRALELLTEFWNKT
mgnify:CR=1 FL=1